MIYLNNFVYLEDFMRPLTDYITISTEYANIDEVVFSSNCLFLHGATTYEERNELSSDFSANHPDVEVAFIDDLLTEQININYNSGSVVYSLRSGDDAENLNQTLK